MTESSDSDKETNADYDAVVVGAGFSGLYSLYRLRDEMGLSVKVIERADDVGGTWYWNRYPGARCDSESFVYCYSFSDEILEEWQWSERYPEQPEVLEYLRFVTDRLDLRRDIDFGTMVTGASFDDGAGVWRVRTDDGAEVSAQFFVSAVGPLSEPYVPDFEGRDSFEGDAYHTARWPHDPVDFEDKHVGVIGTGATGNQVVPEVAEEAGHVTVFQRTPNYSVPARNRPLDEDDWAEIQQRYDEIFERAHTSSGGHSFVPARETAADLTQEEFEELLEPRWEEGGFRFRATFEDLTTNPETNEMVSEFIRDRIREAVDDPELAEKVVPDDHYYATKRPPLHYGYYEALNRDDVSLCDVRANPIQRVTPAGIQTTAAEHELDMIIYATGFDASTGPLLNINIRGRGELTLTEKWADGPKTYLGLGVSGFPNMFTILGPQSPSLLSNMPVSIEQHVEWISDAIAFLREAGIRTIEPTPDAEDAWTEHNRLVAEETLFTTADSFYMNKNVPDQATVFLPYVGGVGTYHDTITEVAKKRYEGFELDDSEREPDAGRAEPQLSVMERPLPTE